MIYNNTSLVRNDSFLFACVQQAFDKKKYRRYPCVEVIFNKNYMKWHASFDPCALLLFGRLGLADKNQEKEP